ncbi:MAG: segregation/condensation protein A [Deltaproteobacteria bacterium]|nr:MAG: segregation/condensation protein A [Deltaproteobacteria bacterium]
MADPLQHDEAPVTEGASAAAGATDPILQVKLPIFEGPLDLLLHLVREHKLDVFDLPIATITEKYLEMVERMRELNLDVAGEFLVMAATLMHIKSRMLLPKPETPEDEEEADAGDPREALVRRLLEYQKYKEAGEALGSYDILDRDVFVRTARPGPLPPEEGDLGLREVSVFKLIEALDRVLAEAKEDLAHEVRLERASVSERIAALVEEMRRRERARFADLFEGQALRHEIIVTFLALLEMARLGLVRVRQEVPEGEIWVERGEGLETGDLSRVQDDFRS